VIKKLLQTDACLVQHTAQGFAIDLAVHRNDTTPIAPSEYCARRQPFKRFTSSSWKRKNGSTGSRFPLKFIRELLNQDSTHAALILACRGSTTSTQTSHSDSGLAAAAHKARQKTKDNTIQIEPSTNSIVIMLIRPSIERARSNFASLATGSASLLRVARPDVQDCYVSVSR